MCTLALDLIDSRLMFGEKYWLGFVVLWATSVTTMCANVPAMPIMFWCWWDCTCDRRMKYIICMDTMWRDRSNTQTIPLHAHITLEYLLLFLLCVRHMAESHVTISNSVRMVRLKKFYDNTYYTIIRDGGCAPNSPVFEWPMIFVSFYSFWRGRSSRLRFAMPTTNWWLINGYLWGLICAHKYMHTYCSILCSLSLQRARRAINNSPNAYHRPTRANYVY